MTEDPTELIPETWAAFEPVWESWHVLAALALGAYLLHFLLQSFLGRRMGRLGDGVALLFSAAAAVFGILTYLQIPASDGVGLWGLNKISTEPSYTWFAVEGGLNIQVGFLLNGTAATMLALVTFITFLVHLFSVEYMKADKRKPRYWAFLSLFAFSMCGVVVANNLFLLFVFWELVGFCSYLLIGFWIEKEQAARSSQKAFIVNRIGDLGFVLGMLVLVANDFSLQLVEPNAVSNLLPFAFPEPPLWAGLFLTMGVIGKSAQFPLQVWLPDAMAGPTPVSSLLHAATMVAAGVYMLLRIEFLYTPEFLTLLAVLGAFTALIAAISALTQTDIKAVLAYSTISQLGFMVMAVGLGAQDFAFFHLITHAFFKCGLFLAAGAVIHHIHVAQSGSESHFDAQDMKLMGGMGKKMPIVAGLYVVFAAALAGLPLFSGFLSKDGILIAAVEQAAQQGGMAWLIPAAAIVASGFTAFYITRHGLLVFGGQPRMESTVFERIRRGNWLVLLPLAVLAFFSLWVVYSPGNPFHAEAHFGVFRMAYADDPLHMDFLPIVFVAVALIGAGGAWLGWRRRAFEKGGKGPVWALSYRHFHLDELYEKGIVGPVLRFASALAWFDKRIVDGAVNAVADGVVKEGRLFSLSGLSDWFDRNVVDRLVNGLAQGTMAIGKRFRKLQSGSLQKYLIYTLLGLLGIFAALIYFT